MRKWIGFASLIVGAIAAVRFVDLEAPGEQPVPAVPRDPFPSPRATQFPRSNGLIDVRAIYELAVTYCESTPVAEVAEEFQTELTEESSCDGLRRVSRR